MSIRKRISTVKGRKLTRYQAEVYVGGIRVQTRTFDTASAAHAWHDETKRMTEIGQLDPSSVKTFREVVSEYRASAFQDLRKSSQQARESRFPYLVETPLGQVLMRNFGPKVIDDWLRWLRTQPTASVKQRQSFNQELKLLSVVLNWYKHEHDHRFIVPIVRRHYRATIFKPVPVRQQDYYMRPEEVVLWLGKLEERPDPVYRRLAFLMVLTGLRMGEAAGLCWDAVHFSNDGHSRLRVARTLSWDYRTKEAYFQDEAKTDVSIRTVPIEGAVVEMLRKLKTEIDPPVGPVPVFKTARGGLLRDNTIRDNFNSAFNACDLNWSGTHIARHTFGTLALVCERDLGAVQATMGHANQKMTALYAKVVALQSSKTSGNVAQLIGLGNASSTV